MEADSGLQVDARQNGLHFRPGAGSDMKYAVPEPEYSAIEPDAAVANHSPTLPESRSRICGLRHTTFVLSVLLAVVLVLGVASAALAGHYATMRDGGFVLPLSSIQPCVMNLHRLTIFFACRASSPACPAVNSAGGASNSSNSSSSSNNNSTLHLTPTTNCTSLSTQWTAPYTKAQFNLHCKTDFVGNDLFGTFTYTFEDCINNCALYNQHFSTRGIGNCIGVSYTINATAFPPSYIGNCFLKGASGAATVSPDTSSAVAVNS